MSTFK
jgi:hypothetical protein